MQKCIIHYFYSNKTSFQKHIDRKRNRDIYNYIHVHPSCFVYNLLHAYLNNNRYLLKKLNISKS